MKLNLQKIKDILPSALAFASIGGVVLTAYTANRAGKKSVENPQDIYIRNGYNCMYCRI